MAKSIKVCPKCGKELTHKGAKGQTCQKCKVAQGKAIRDYILKHHPLWVKTYKEIAADLNISQPAVDYHLQILRHGHGWL